MNNSNNNRNNLIIINKDYLNNHNHNNHNNLHNCRDNLSNNNKINSIQFNLKSNFLFQYYFNFCYIKIIKLFQRSTTPGKGSSLK